LLTLAVLLCSCNKDDIIEDASALKPIIILDSEYGVYSVKTGHELTIAPEFKNIENATITWTLDDGQVVCQGTQWTATWNNPGEYYVTISATNSAGTTSEEIRIDVLDLTPPIISLPLPADGLTVATNTDCTLTPDLQHDDMEWFAIRWFVNGNLRSENRTYTFNESTPGTYHIRIEAENPDGISTKEFDIVVVENVPCRAWFLTPSYFQESTTRYTFAGRPVYLRPELELFSAPTFSWSVDGESVDYEERQFRFTPTEPGEYNVKVVVTDRTGGRRESVTRNITRSWAPTASAEVSVVCVNATEQQRMRPTNGNSSPWSDTVFEWTPAPGQFIGDTSPIGGMTGNETTLAEASAWAQKRLEQNLFVSLGSFGGYIIVGFDHSIASGTAEYDLAVGGNAFLSDNGSSNEPGIVWVMQDVNGNGLPDDEWYELKGSEYDAPASRRNYAVTYYRPEGPAMDVVWADAEGNSGTVNYMGFVHRQDFYYPTWVTASAYTLYGSSISARNSEDPVTGYWTNAAYPWGYADNVGSDNINDQTTSGEGQQTGFKFSNAVFADGTPVNLQYVDFVKVQVAVLAKSGALGEVSTEVCGFRDLSMP